MSQVTFIFCAIVFLIAACKSRDEAQLASESVGTEVFTLKGHRVFRFVCAVGEEAPNYKDWNFQELDELLESHVDYAAYKVVAPALRDIESATKDIANVKAAMEKETRSFQKKGMQARIDVQETAILKLQEVVKAHPKGEAVYAVVEEIRGKFVKVLGGIGEFRGQDWSRWLDAGALHTCALSQAAKPICWGSNGRGESDGHRDEIKQDMLPLKMISTEGNHTCALTRTGEPVCWGSNGRGESDGHRNEIKQDMLPLKMMSAGGVHTCALTRRGEPICWGRDFDGESHGHKNKIKPDMLPLAMISAGDRPTCALTRMGEPVCWGNDFIYAHEVKTKPDMLPLKIISAGVSHACALTRRGEPICWGDNDDNMSDGHKRKITPDMLPLTTISAGWRHTCALTRMGEPVCWGSNDDGRSDGHEEKIKPDMLPLKMISAGGQHTCALTRSGKAICWGSNAEGQVTGRSPEGYKLGLNVPEDVDLSLAAFYYGDN